MPDDTDDTAGGGGAGGKGPESPKKKAQRERLIVGGTIILVILTYLLYRRSQANAAAASTATAPTYDPSQFAGPGTYGGGSASTMPAPGVGFVSPNDPTIMALQQEIGALQAATSAMPANGIGTPGPTVQAATPAAAPAGGGPSSYIYNPPTAGDWSGGAVPPGWTPTNVPGVSIGATPGVESFTNLSNPQQQAAYQATVGK
jgi:hypothetical protein